MRIMSGCTPRDSARSTAKELAHDVDDWLARGDEGRLAVDLSKGRHEVVGSPAEAAAVNS
jgi:hypothetical protein